MVFWLLVFTDGGHFAWELCDPPRVGGQGGSHVAGRERPASMVWRVHFSCQIRNTSVYSCNYYEG